MTAETVLIVSSLSFVIQLVALSLIIAGYSFKRLKKYRQHGIIMATALVLHIITVLAVMIPSFLSFYSFIIANPGETISIIASTHGILGLIAAILGIFLVGSWRLQQDMQMCFRRKRIMDATIIAWITALLLGIYLYLSIIA